jgi:hypothetical protein
MRLLQSGFARASCCMSCYLSCLLHLQGSFQWALWVNTSKNPRLKAVEMSALHMVVEIPKQVALANIALRIVITEKVGGNKGDWVQLNLQAVTLSGRAQQQ